MCSAEVSATAQLSGCCASPPVWILCRGAVCSAPTGATLTADAKCLRIYNLKLKKGMIKSAAGFHIHAAKIHVQCANSKLKFGKSSRRRGSKGCQAGSPPGSAAPRKCAPCSKRSARALQEKYPRSTGTPSGWVGFEVVINLAFSHGEGRNSTSSAKSHLKILPP